MKDDKSRIYSFLERFDLSEIEIELYLGLLEMGPTTVLELARHTGNKRTTVHVNVESLIQKGLIAQTKKGVRRRIFAEGPEKLAYLLEERKLRLERLEDKLPTIMTEISKLSESTDSSDKVDVRYYEGKKRLSMLYDDVVKAKKVWSIVNISKILEVFPENERKFVDAMENGLLEMWEITEPISDTSGEGYVNESQYHTKTLPKDRDPFGIDIMLYDDKTVLIDYNDPIPTAVVIENRAIFKGMLTMFEFMWETL